MRKRVLRREGWVERGVFLVYDTLTIMGGEGGGGVPRFVHYCAGWSILDIIIDPRTPSPSQAGTDRARRVAVSRVGRFFFVSGLIDDDDE